MLYLASLRQAVGNSFRNGVLATQNAGNELVRVDPASPGDNTIWLWFTPNDLYVRGVTAADGTTYVFNEPWVNITGVQRFNNFGDVQKRVAILMGQPNFVSSRGDWSHTEL